MQSFQEFSFDVYKYADEKKCALWDDIVDFKYIFIPEYEEYFEIYVKIDETDNTVKHVTAKSAAEVELSNRMISNYHFNDETDIGYTARYTIKKAGEGETYGTIAYEPVIEGYYYNNEFYEDSGHTTMIAPATGTIYLDVPSGTRYRWNYEGGGYNVETDPPQPACNKQGVVDFEYDTEEGYMIEGQTEIYRGTVLYREIEDTDSEWLKMKKRRSSLLYRVLNDKYPEWTIAHVDKSIANIQRTFTADNTNPYTFLTSTVAQELDCLFKFDSVHRTISAYDLDNTCGVCGHRGNFVYRCPKCGNEDIDKITQGYGNNSGIYISTDNFAQQISIDGDTDNVKSAFKVSGGDDVITAAVANLNPNGSNYIYHFSKEMLDEMPIELVERLQDYEEKYNAALEQYTALTEDWYKAIDEQMRLEHSMMPDTPVPGNTSAEEQVKALATEYANGQTVGLKGIEKSTSTPTAYDSLKKAITKAVEGMSKAILDPRYTVEVVKDSDAISDYNTQTKTRTWTGKFTVTSLGKVNAKGEKEEATSESVVTVTINNDEEEYYRQKIQKSLDRTDAGLITLFKIEDDTEFENTLKEYSYSRLESFESTYNGVLEVLAGNGVTEENKEFFTVPLYKDIYLPIEQRRDTITKIKNERNEEVQAAKKAKEDLAEQREAIQNTLNIEDYLGDYYSIFKLYLRESEFTNSNYISTGLDLEGMDYNTEVIDKAQELLDVANEELLKASELQVTLSDTLNNLLSTKEFSNWKGEFEIGDWILNEIDDTLYKLRLIGVNINYDSKDISVTFSNAVRYRNHTSDVASILSSAQSIATTYNYTAHQAKQGDEAKNSLDNMETNGMDAATFNVVAGTDNGVVIDEHGILCTAIDDLTGEVSDKQMKILNNMIAFTTDNWETVRTGIGEIRYAIDGVEQEPLYGVNAEIMIAGKMIAGDIYSANYSSTNHTGTHIDLNDGDLHFAGDKIVYNHGTDVLDINVAHINYGSGVNTPTVSQIDGLSTALAAKQDKLTAGANITIDANNVISATGGGGGLEYFEETQNSLYGSQTATTPYWSCLDGYYYDTTFNAELYAWYGPQGRLPVNKTRDIPCISLATNFVHWGGSNSGGLFFISKEINGTEFEYFNTSTEQYTTAKYNATDRDYDAGGNFHVSSGTYTYNNETWYYCCCGGGGQDITGADGVEYIQYLNGSYPEDPGQTVARIFNLVSPYDITELCNGISRTNNLAFFAGGTDGNGSHAPIKIYNDGTYEGLDKLEDVKVDNVSVVTDKVANIDLSGKQDTLIAGDNITIVNNVISATGGGGGGSTEPAYTETVLWEDVNGTTFYPSSPQTITLFDNISDYHMIYIDTTIDNDTEYHNTNIVPVSALDKTGTNYFDVVNIGGHEYNCPAILYDDETHLILQGYASSNPIVAWKIVGIKFGGNLSPIIYSTDEREVGVWTDNKPLYQKTISLTITSTTTTISSISNIDTLVKAHGILADNNGDMSEIPYTDGEDFVGIGFVNDNIGVYTSNWFVNNRPNLTLTVWYTKTTDTPGSGSYNTLGVPMVHYTIDEQVVGTDYDGETIYQKTFTNLGTISSSTNFELSSLSDISWITVDSVNSSLSNSIPFPYVHPNTNNMVGYFFSINNGVPTICCRAGGDAAGGFSLDKLTVRYKKSNS